MKKLIATQKGLSSSVVEFTTTELNYLLDVVEQDIIDYEEDYGELHKQTLEDVCNKLIILLNK